MSQAHATYYSLTTQSIADTAAAQAIELEEEGDELYLIHDTVTNNSRVYVPWDGSYEVVFSGIANLDSVANKHLEVWYAIDGVAVPDSNTRVHIPNASAETTVVVSAILDIDAGSYLEIMTWGDSTSCQWLATEAGTSPDRPAVPSVIITVKCVNAY
jgi:hypothetical protein